MRDPRMGHGFSRMLRKSTDLKLSVRVRDIRVNPCPIRAFLSSHSSLVAAEGLPGGIRGQFFLCVSVADADFFTGPQRITLRDSLASWRIRHSLTTNCEDIE